MRKLLLLICSLPLLATAQEKGIHFTHAATWDEVLAKAKAENKMIFVDAFTTWCGPCKYLSKEIFTQDAVGKYFNEHFISVKMQLDTTEADNEQVKQWYPTTSKVMHALNVNVFPTLLFFDANGNPVHRFAGASDGNKLVADAAKALDPDQQFYTLQKRYNAGDRDVTVLRNFSNAALFAYQPEVAAKAFTDYMEATGSQVNKDNAQLVYAMVSKPGDLAFEMIARDTKAFDAAFGKPGAAQERIMAVLSDSFLEQMVQSGPSGRVTEQVAALKTKYPKPVAQAEAKARVYYYQYKTDWTNFPKYAALYMKQYGSSASAEEKNNLAWSVFEHVNDKASLTEALAWSKAAMATGDPNFMDTYANLLHKLGRTPEALAVETKAMAMVPEAEKESYRKNIEKMKKGEKTW
jgi:thioredoxin-related protein